MPRSRPWTLRKAVPIDGTDLVVDTSSWESGDEYYALTALLFPPEYRGQDLDTLLNNSLDGAVAQSEATITG